MEIEIINIKKKEGEIYLISKCVKPTQQETPLIARDSDATAVTSDALFAQYSAEYKIAMVEFRKTIKQIHLGVYELPL